MATIQYVVNAVDSASATFARIAGSADDLITQIDDLGSKSATARVGLEGDKEAKLTLDSLDLKLGRLAEKVATPGIDVKGRAAAQLAIDRVSLAMDRLDAKRARIHIEGTGPAGWLDRRLFSALGGGSGALGAAAPAAGGGLSLGGWGALAGAIAGVTALLSGAGGIIPALTSATMGVGAFGVLAIPTFTKVSGAITKIKADTAAYDRATTAAAKSTALKHIHEDWAALSPAQAAIVKGVQGLGNEFSKLSAKLAPTALKVFNDGLKIANKLLPDLLPFALIAGSAIDRLLKQFDKFASSPGFRSFLLQMENIAGPAIIIIGQGLGRITVAIGKLLLALMNPNMLRALSGLFTTIQWVIQGLAFAISYTTPRIIDKFHKIAVAFDFVRHSAAIFGHDTAYAFDTFRRNVAAMGHNTAVIWDTLRHDAAATGHDIAHTFDVLRHDLAVAWDTIWRNTVTRVANGISDTVDWFRKLPGRAVGALYGLGHQLYAFGHAALNEMWSGFKAIGGSIISWVGNFARNIWNKVKSFFGISSPSSLFYDIGKNLMLGLFHGIKDHAHHAIGAIGAVADTGARSGSAALAQRYAAGLLGRFGWGPSQFSPLLALWNRESGWNAYAVNPSSGAYGIPQSLGHGHPYNLGDYKAQIIWGLNYIMQRYGSPAAAWGHEMQFGWYDRGGFLPTGWSLALNTTGRPEPVGGGGGNTYVIHNHVPPGANLAEVGRVTVEAIRQFERRSGPGWRK